DDDLSEPVAPVRRADRQSGGRSTNRLRRGETGAAGRVIQENLSGPRNTDREGEIATASRVARRQSLAEPVARTADDGARVAVSAHRGRATTESLASAVEDVTTAVAAVGVHITDHEIIGAVAVEVSDGHRNAEHAHVAFTRDDRAGVARRDIGVRAE